MSTVAKITLFSYSTGRRVTLSASRARLFEKELRRITTFCPSQKGILPRVAPDCLIVIKRGKKKSEYELYARAVLLHKRTRKIWQFYFGLLLLTWLK